ncbi:MAG: hypothetical protein SFW09_06075 [Hyphomicrobiaceae bacterium]|nr:hypothetical protein [Hyphomicrobiaceae bacterium]
MDATQGFKQTIERWLYPELAKIAPHHRARALEKARAESFDFLEVACILAAIVTVTYLTRYSLKDAGVVDRLSAALANFVVALPQLLLFAGPFFVRRTRRGLRLFLDDQRRA